MRLYEHQSRNVREIKQAFSEGHRRVLSVSPTASGKGTIAAKLMADESKASRRSVFVVHRRSIVDSIAKRLRDQFGLSAGVIMPGHPRFASAQVQVVSVQTLAKMRPSQWPRADLLVEDEAHHYTAEEWAKIAAHYSKERTLGFTATPQRADGHGMCEVFDHLVVGATYSELLASGHIVPCEVLRPEAPAGIDLAMSSIEAYQRFAVGPTIIYERTVPHAQRTKKSLVKLGIRAEIITHRTSTAQHDAILERFREGRDLDVLVNVYVLTEGVDLPATTTIILARPCEHASTYVQICGRALRTSPGKKVARLVDLSGASFQHGLPTDDREYTLDGAGMRQTRIGHSNGGGPVRTGKVLGVPLICANPDVLSARPLDRRVIYWDRERFAVAEGRKSMRAARSAYRYEFGIDAPRHP